MDKFSKALSHVRRVIDLLDDYGISIDGKEIATEEGQLRYRESKVKFNAIKALESLNEGIANNTITVNAATLDAKNPRTKEVYEKAECNSFFDLSEPFNLQELYFDANGDEDKKSKILTELHLSQLFFRQSTIYRKVEKPIEWWEDACEYVKCSSSDDWELEVTNKGNVMRMTAEMTRDQWCDFARIILEQESD